MKQATSKTIDLNGRKVDYRLVRSKSARKLRVRVGPSGIEVVQPARRNGQELDTFLISNQEWIFDQLDRVERLRSVRKPLSESEQGILFRGVQTPVRLEVQPKSTNRITLEHGTLVVIRGVNSRTPAARSLENWLRKRARQEILDHLSVLTKKLGRSPHRVYVMGQRTKWGNCSSLRNLSYNWRLVMAPDFVLSYLVTHEYIHLGVPDHSKRFWLTVQSLCPEMDRAKRWLSANSDQMMIDLNHVCRDTGRSMMTQA